MSRKLAATLNLVGSAGKQFGTSILDLILPPTCRLCDTPVSSGDFCPACQRTLTLSEPMMRSACHRCGIPRPRVAGQGAADEPKAAHCVHCKDLNFSFDSVVTLWSYQDRVCEAVVTAKYAHQSPLADALGRRLAERVVDRMAESPADLVTYVPSHVTRQFARGGNGNQTIASAVSRKIGRPCRDVLKLTRRIAKQAWLDDRQRFENVRNAFSLKRSYAFRGPEIADRHILLVDDVLTTGATANEVARVLREGGARCVTLAVVARAIRS